MKPLDFLGGEPLKLLGTKLAVKALAHAVDLVPRPLTLSLLLSLLQRLTSGRMCKGSRVRREMEMDNTLQFTHDPLFGAKSGSHSVTGDVGFRRGCLPACPLRGIFWTSDLAEPGTNGEH